MCVSATSAVCATVNCSPHASARHLAFNETRVADFCALAPQLSEWLTTMLARCRAVLSKADALYRSVSPSCTQPEFSAAVASLPPGLKRLLFDTRKDGRFATPSAFVCSPDLFPDVKTTRRYFASIVVGED